MAEETVPIAPRPALSVILVAYNMARELPRTLASLSRRMQPGTDGLQYEIIVVDNGSVPPVSLPYDPMVSIMRVKDASPSPAAAVNRAVEASGGDLVGVFVDGARLASPGILRLAAQAAKLHHRPVIATLGFHLGPEMQVESVAKGYDQAQEDALLTSSGWQEDGYRLFRISTFAGSSADGWFQPIAESNALFMPRELWRELGGYDERFVCPGGGLMNLDLYKRACELPETQLVVLLGEGTFHQVHGGVATNALVSPWAEFHGEYVAIRGQPYVRPSPDPLYLGHVRSEILPTLALSVDKARRAFEV